MLFAQLNEHMMYVAVWAFLSRISDPRFGGMYVTLFSAMSTMGYRWPISVCLWCMNMLTIRSCVQDELKVSTYCIRRLGEISNDGTRDNNTNKFFRNVERAEGECTI